MGKSGENQEVNVYIETILSALWRMFLLFTAISLLELVIYYPAKKSPYNTLMLFGELFSVLLQGLMVLIFYVMSKYKKKDVSVFCMDMISMLIINVFFFCPAWLHRDTLIVGFVLLIPLSILSIYVSECWVWLQLGISILLYAAIWLNTVLRQGNSLSKEHLMAAVVYGVMGISIVIIEKRIRLLFKKQDIMIWKDPLTQLYNHEAFYEVLEENMKQFEKEEIPFSILIADIDNFKRINDTYGHSYGDKVICALTQVMTKNVGNEDTVARYGGEEFTIVMPYRGMRDSILLADKIRREFSKLHVEGEGEHETFTISIGVAEYDKIYKTASAFFQEADKALYVAKATGKNRVCNNRTQNG